MKPVFTAADAWKGGYYELAIELGNRSDERLRAAVVALWSSTHLDGCFSRWDVEPSEQLRIQPQSTDLHQTLLGIATLPVRQEDGVDWLDFCLPMGSMSEVYPVGMYPFEDGTDSRVWREPVDAWLLTLAERVFDVAPFQLAFLGGEVSGSSGAEEIGHDGIPEERWIGYLWRVGEGLRWYPPNRYEGDFTVGP
jgi:hypothetical protein